MTTPTQIREIISAATEPRKMSKQEALDFLEEVAADLEGSIDALKDEIAANL